MDRCSREIYPEKCLASASRDNTIFIVLRLISESTGLRFAAALNFSPAFRACYTVDGNKYVEINSRHQYYMVKMLGHEVSRRVHPSIHHPQYHRWIPIATSSGMAVGALCGLDAVSNPIEKSEVNKALELFAELLADYIALYRR
ncbi:hypothetical protein PSPPH_A0067 (plasmid) [Pseudomonas savastanoi pv. phaseolicola 1448A]|nr:hypothetical protein PSPPH_A0067 [Pseudomonas savastanoi pv. phaseolicola 1448A]RML32266.1 hypothetical protein ALQ97_101367 [Pseudomonas savastanoi pv. glycinea]